MTIKKQTLSNEEKANFEMEVVAIYNKMKWIIKMHMFLCNSIYPLPHHGVLSANNDGDHDYVSRYKSYYQKDKPGWIG